MASYLIRRLLLIPVTLFCIILVNFVILNLAPGDPTTQTEISQEGSAVRREQGSQALTGDDRYLQFRQFYGLTLPILFNDWPWTSIEKLKEQLWQITYKRQEVSSDEEMPFSRLQDLKTLFGDRAFFVMPQLLTLLQDPQLPLPERKQALRFFIRGATGFAEFGPTLTEKQKNYNRFIGEQNLYLSEQTPTANDDLQQTMQKQTNLEAWYKKNKDRYDFEPTTNQLTQRFFTQTRFFRYMSRVLTLDFGTLRNDNNKRVIDEVTKRFKYSLTLSLLPMLATFFLCLLFGFTMALNHNKIGDYGLSLLFLLLYATPIFVVGPFLIEKIAFNNHFWGTDIPIPLGGFTSSEEVYSQMNSWQRLWDILAHIALPLVAILYGSLAAQSRLARTAILEVQRCDFVRTAKAKGVKKPALWGKHIGRNASITIVTSLAASLGVVLGGSLIVETLFQIDGFGKFFYEAIVNRDYNVVMFSALAGAFLSLVGYLIADLAYAALDPRISLE